MNSNKILTKVLNYRNFPNYKKNFIIDVLESFDNEHMIPGRNVPLDMHIRKFFLKHKSINSIDREFIADQVYSLIRYKGLLDFLAKPKINWNTRMEVFYDDNFSRHLENPNIPSHIRLSFPSDLYNLIKNAYGVDRAYEYCTALNERAPLTIRVNLLKVSREDLFKNFIKKGFRVKKTEHSPLGITFIENPKTNFFNLDEFKKGYFEIQDEGSQLASLRVDCDIILDYCGGAAGKSLAIAPFTKGKGQIFIHDIRKNILLEAKKRMRRAGVENYQLCHDKSRIKELLSYKCDWVLLDVPCSGTGTLRRNPDLKWKFSLDKLNETKKVQEMIIEEALSLIKPNGKIVYVTCSLLREENIDQIMKAVKKFGLKIQNDSIFQTFPKQKGMDSFFSTTLTKI